MSDNVKTFGQYMTPAWAADAIVSHLGLDKLSPGAVVIEPSCGIGRFLDALPSHVNSIGVDIDPRMVAEARARGHHVLLGDFRTVRLPVTKVDAVLGNPPFQMEIFDGMMERIRHLLEDGGEASFILPCYAFQTSSRVVRWNQDWSLAQEMLPRTLFPGLSKPLMLARFTRDPQPKMQGLILYHETDEVEAMPRVYRKALEEGRSGWQAVVEAVLSDLGGEAALDDIYRKMAPQRPTTNSHWKAKVRQTLGRHFTRTGPAQYALAA